MDNDTGNGVKINSQLLSKPDKNKRATFVVMNPVRALQQQNQAIITASCAYVSNRLSKIDEVHVRFMQRVLK